MNMLKNSEEISNESLEKIKKIFFQITEESTYNLVYAYSMKSGLFGKKIGSFILGLSHDQTILKIVPFDLYSREVGSVITLMKSEILSAKRTLQGNTVIDSSKLSKKMKLIIPPFTSKIAENMHQLPINQETNENLFREFFKEIGK